MLMRIVCLSPLILPTLLACSSSSDAPATYPVTGVVTQNSQPVAGALVQFHPTSADYGPLPEGAAAIGGQVNTADDGTYTVEVTFDRGKTSVRGLPAGAYAVTVVKMEFGPGGPDIRQAPKNVLDPRYATVQTTPVKVTITAEGPHKVDIPL
jgi:hypothetical protein